jgi:hypothetical protein
LKWQNFHFLEQLPAGVTTSGIGNNSNNSFLYPKNKDAKGRIAPENYTVGHYRMKI